MKITFILPTYPYHAVGGFRIVYLYTNFLAQRGHEVAVVDIFKRGPVDDPIPLVNNTGVRHSREKSFTKWP